MEDEEYGEIGDCDDDTSDSILLSVKDGVGTIAEIPNIYLSDKQMVEIEELYKLKEKLENRLLILKAIRKASIKAFGDSDQLDTHILDFKIEEFEKVLKC